MSVGPERRTAQAGAAATSTPGAKASVSPGGAVTQGEPANASVDPPAQQHAPAQRIDKWLWYARVVKTRTLAAKLVTTGKVRVNRKPVDKASHGVSAGDVITVVVARNVRVLEVVAPGARRGPAPEARALYNDLTEPQPTADPAAPEGAKPQRDPGSGRPTKRDRRQLDRLRSTDA